MLTSTKHHKIGDLEFKDKNDKLRIGHIYEVRITINEHVGIDIVYCVNHKEENRDCFIDGDTFREI